MIQEPARVKKAYSPSCVCTGGQSYTVPIIIDSYSKPRILLLKVPQKSLKNSISTSSSSNSNRTEQRAPRTRFIRIPFLPRSVPTTSSVKQTLPSANSLANFTNSATASRIAATTSGMTIYPDECSTSSSNCCSPAYQAVNDQMEGPPTMTSEVPTVQVSNTPLTLASMAGIQLTGADTLSHLDMSGAMPTATVEEINVPVFIDGYLQDIEATSPSNSNGSENGNDICTGTDILDFDMSLFAEHRIDALKMDQGNNILNNNDDLNDDLSYLDCANMLKMEDEDVKDLTEVCRGINFNDNNPDGFDWNAYLQSSQDPMLTSSSQNSFKFIHELPQIAEDFNETDSCYGYSQTSLGFGMAEEMHEVKPTILKTNDSMNSVYDACIESGNTCVGVKRAAAVSYAPAQPQKRAKLALALDTTKTYNNTEIVRTPQIIDEIISLDLQHNAEVHISTHEKIYQDLRQLEQNAISISTLIDFSAPSTPKSPQSVSSSSAQTNHSCVMDINTAPTSPAYSTTSTRDSFRTTETKRKRGRPAKNHSDGPDPELMASMSEEATKQYMDRLKNNEASRVSRQKTRQREEEEKKLEESLQSDNNLYKAQLCELERLVKRYKRAIQRKHQQNSTYKLH